MKGFRNGFPPLPLIWQIVEPPPQPTGVPSERPGLSCWKVGFVRVFVTAMRSFHAGEKLTFKLALGSQSV